MRKLRLRLTPAQRRVLAFAARHRDGRVISSALPTNTINKLAKAGLIEQDGWSYGPLWRITNAGRAEVKQEQVP